MEFNFTRYILVAVGWLYLFLRHRNFEKMKVKLQKEYNNEYAVAGSQLLMSFVLIIVGILIFIMAVTLIYAEGFRG